jgi:putative hydrolase of the HAD superfamily
MICYNGRLYSAVIFDWNLTLIEFEQLLPSAAELIRRAGHPCADSLANIWLPDSFDGCETPTRMGGMYENWRQENLNALARYCDVPDVELNGLVTEILRTESSHVLRPRAGAVELLTELRSQGVAIGICSNWDYCLKPSLVATGLYGLVDAWVTSSEEGARKPHIRIFTAICNRLGVQAADALHCGDTWNADVVGALRAGLTPIWITTQRSPIPQIMTASTLLDLKRLLLNDDTQHPS